MDFFRNTTIYYTLLAVISAVVFGVIGYYSDILPPDKPTTSSEADSNADYNKEDAEPKPLSDTEDDDANKSIVETDDAMYTYEMMVDDIGKLCGTYGDVLTKEVAGNSLDNRKIYCLYLGNKNAKHRIFTQASIHGREYMNTQLVMSLIEYYCRKKDEEAINGKTYSELLDEVCISIVPMANPDGVTISQSGAADITDPELKPIPFSCFESDVDYMIADVDMYGDWFWVDHYNDRTYNKEVHLGEYIKYDEYLRQWKSNARGVDLNTNFDGNWEGVSSKSHPSYSIYKGDSALSEPESACLADLAQKYDYDMYISYHSKGNIVYYDTKGNKPSVSEESEKLAKLVAGHLNYLPFSNKTAENVRQGGFGDWVQLSLNKPSITIESGFHRCPLDIEEFKPMWDNHRQLWAVLMDSLVSESTESENHGIEE